MISKTLSFADEQAAISQLAAASTMQLMLEGQGDEPMHFEFPLAGSSGAIASMWSRCR